jgi:hypothetical protein
MYLYDRQLISEMTALTISKIENLKFREHLELQFSKWENNIERKRFKDTQSYVR